MLAINIEDVKKVLTLCAPYLIAFGVVLILALIVMIGCMKLSRDKKFLLRTQSGIAIALAFVTIVNLICFGPMNTMISLVTGKGTITEESTEEAQELCEDIADEGIVLLENDGMLPLPKDTKLNVFGWASTNPCYGGTGSGALSGSYPTVSLLDGLENAGITVNEELVDFYTEYREDRPEVGMWAQDWTLPEPPAETYGDELVNNAKEFSDQAMIVITRVGGEGADLPTNMEYYEYQNNSEEYPEYVDDGHFLELTQSEKDMIELVSENFEDVTLVYNGANPMELGFVEEYPQIKSVLWCPGTGQTGFNGLGNVLTGEANPSGRTVDTFVYDLTMAPSFYNSCDFFAYDNMDEFYYEYEPGDGWSPFFVNYVESIYVGYKFYETAAEEGVIKYEDTVQYPFGHGLSYTTFEQEMGEISEENGVLTFDVTVTNTGDVAGKDVVEVYYNPPYTNGGIEKASANLVAFDKTNILEPGESETVSFSVKTEDMASYDAKDAGCYVLEEGDYGISIRSNSHDIIDEKVYTVEKTIVYDEENKRSTDQEPAVNRFDDVAGEVTYLSRKDNFANMETALAYPENFSMPEKYKTAFINNSNYDTEEYNNPEDKAPTLGAKNGLKLEDLRGKDYDDPMWEALLDQLTVKNMNAMISLGGYQTSPASSVGKVQTVDCDGPASINNNFTRQGSIGFPSGVMISATWNEELAHAFGSSIGKMADEMGVSGWYAPAMNIHRSAFAGRNFEYYSEDALLSGKIASQAVLGAKDHGVYAYVKHFALNDQENARDLMLCTWADEQTIREIYLKPFELAVKEGGCQAVMSSFNYIGTTWAGGSSALLQDVLRSEWGFQGMVLTDYYQGMGYMDAEQGIRNGNDICLTPYDSGTNNVHDTESATSLLAMRQACKNIMYTTVNSRAYAPENLSTGPQTWQIILVIADVLVVLILIGLEVLILREKRLKGKTLLTGAVTMIVITASLIAISIPVGKAVMTKVQESGEAVEETAEETVEETEEKAGEATEEKTEKEVPSDADLILADTEYTTVTEGQDWGPAVTKVVIHPETQLDGESVAPEKLTVTSVRTFPDVDYETYEMSEPVPHEEERAVTAAYLSDETGVQQEDGEYLTLELEIAPYLEAGSPFWFNLLTNQNEYIDIDHVVSTTENLTTADGKTVALSAGAENNKGNATLLADDFDTTGTYTYTYDEGNREIPLTYASWFPKDDAEEASTPLLIWLHGMGEGGTDPNVAILGNKVVNLITEDVQQYFGETGAAVLAPQTPTMWLDTSGSGNMAMGTANSESYYTEALMSLITDFVTEHPEIDPSRLYIGGCSNGGYMTINMLVNYPGVFAAAYPVCEPYQNDWLTEEKLEPLVETPIWLTAAKSDTIVTIYEGYWEEEAPYLYRVTTDENGEEVPVYEYSNALYDRLVSAGAEDVHYSLFDKVQDTTGLYKEESGEPYEYDGHWSWIYTLNNECTEEIDGKEVSIFEWLAGHESEGTLPQLPFEKTVYENPINFYLIRHGETEYNVEGIMQGWTDSPLTENGIDLSKKLGEGLADVSFTAAYSSDSGRAVDTAKNVLEGRDMEIAETELLREMNFGEKDGKSSEGVYTDENMGYRFSVGFDDLGGETWEELGNRMHSALETVALEHREEGGNILISTHGMSVLAALYALVPDAEGVMEQGEIDNCSVTILEWDNGVYTLKALNDISYLE